MTEADALYFGDTIICWLCGRESDAAEREFKYHCHITAKCRAPPHGNCNQQIKTTKVVLYQLCSTILLLLIAIYFSEYYLLRKH